MANTSFTVSVADPTTTISVSAASDPDAVTAAVQNFVTTANAALAKVKSYTDSSDSTAPLRGNYNLTSMAGQILDAVSTAVNGNSSAVAGLQLTKDGALTFDAATFKAKFASDPATVQKIFGGTTLLGPDGVANTPDDTVDTDGIGARLTVLADQASDSTTGILISLAKGQDTQATDLQSQIDAWDLRLTQRQATLTAQFTAMETALSTLQNQASWLSSQISSLPSWNSSDN
jgi:flagellar hook-associated protein 2